jgi:hypothetical protein
MGIDPDTLFETQPPRGRGRRFAGGNHGRRARWPCLCTVGSQPPPAALV